MTRRTDAVSRRHVLAAAGAVLSPCATTVARAEPFPAGALRIVVPFPPAGPTDALARILAEAIKDRLSGPVVVENKPGAAGTIGARHVLQAPADGATWLVGNNQTHATAPFLIRDAGYDPRADFIGVAGLVDMHHVLVVRNDLGLGDVAALIGKARAAPAKLNYGSTGVGSGSHLAMEMLAAKAGIKMQHVPFQGAAQMAGEIAAGRLDLALAVLPTVAGPIASAQMRALAVAGRDRAPQLPSVPTLSEAGLAGAEAESWLALFARAGTPSAAIARMSAIVGEALARPEVRARIEKLGLSVRFRSAAELTVFQSSEIARWGEVIRAAGLQAE